MVDMDENDINNPAGCFVEELKEIISNNDITASTDAAKELESNEQIAKRLSMVLYQHLKAIGILIRKRWNW